MLPSVATWRARPWRRPPSIAAMAVALSLVATLGACNDEDSFPSLAAIAGMHSAADRESGAPKPTIVLVHGAFADATGWQDVIPYLQRAGYKVAAVQNPLTTVDDDIASTRRVVDAQPGDVILVGHSYGGVAISGAASGNAKVKALVYVAAFAPDAGESVGSLNAMFAPTPLMNAVQPDAAGFVYIKEGKYREVFAQDLPESRTRVMAVSQKPASFATLSGGLPVAGAWHSIPAWYIVAQQDRTINPDLERFMAKRMNANTIEVASSHLPFVSRPSEVAKVILSAAGTVTP